jgi:hypothetical protein
MDTVLSLLAFAAMFYVMMRFGCGAHLSHRHRSRSSHAGSAGRDA